MNFDYQRLYLTTEGRIGRQDFWMGILGFVVAGIILSIIIYAIAGSTSVTARVLNFVVQLLFAYPSYALLMKRFQDRDKPGSYAIIIVGLSLLSGVINLFWVGAPMQGGFFGAIVGIVILAIVIWVVVELGILRGTVGANQYGPDPVAGP